MTTLTAGVTRHALQALTHHITSHELPTPVAIYLDGHTFDGGIHVSIAAVDAVAWADSIEVDVSGGEQTATAMHYHADGRLPDTGVRVRLTWVDLTAPARTACEICEKTVDGDVHGDERGQTLCSECCWADKRGGTFALCCATGAVR